MERQHAAQITWTNEQVSRGLPTVVEAIDPTWVGDDVPLKDEGWSVVCRFDRTPRDQGNPSSARVHFLAPDAPHSRLTVGASLQLFERDTSRFAAVKILD